MRRNEIAVLLAAVMGLQLSAGCGHACSDYVAAGLNVTVTDALTGAGIANAEVLAVAQDGTQETLRPSSDTGLYAGAYEMSDTFAIKVSRTGYSSQQVDDVVVGQGECHVIAEQVHVALQRSTP